MKIWQKFMLYGVLIAFIFIIIIIIIEKRRIYKKNFKGRISKISYGEKNFVYVIVNNKKYSLGSLRKEFKQKVSVNDSLIKVKDNFDYIILTKRGEILKF